MSWQLFAVDDGGLPLFWGTGLEDGDGGSWSGDGGDFEPSILR